MLKMLSIVIGGGLGALLRYFVSGATYQFFNGGFPWGTLVVNLAGSFVIGLVWSFSERLVMSPNLKTLVLIGLLGAFTTFSTYSLETANLLRDGELRLALWNILASNILGLAFVLAGIVMSRYVMHLFR